MNKNVDEKGYPDDDISCERLVENYGIFKPFTTIDRKTHIVYVKPDRYSRLTQSTYTCNENGCDFSKSHDSLSNDAHTFSPKEELDRNSFSRVLRGITRCQAALGIKYVDGIRLYGDESLFFLSRNENMGDPHTLMVFDTRDL
jgi:hypothetical protein